MFHPISLRWSDFDANVHLRHSVYYDFGAAERIDLFEEKGIGYDFMKQEHFGPVLFREEALFKREVRPGDKLYINTMVTRLRANSSRFSFRHEIKKEDGTICAIINIDCAWIDTNLRKLTTPPPKVAECLGSIPKSEDFEWI